MKCQSVISNKCRQYITIHKHQFAHRTDASMFSINKVSYKCHKVDMSQMLLTTFLQSVSIKLFSHLTQSINKARFIFTKRSAANNINLTQLKATNI